MATELALITTVNEAASIAGLVGNLRRLGLAVLVVDAGSTDSTAALAESAGATVLKLPRMPIRHALLAGWDMALVGGYGHIVQLDAGGSHYAGDVTRLLCAVHHGCDMAVGSRFAPGAVYHGRPRRREMSRLAAAACRLKTGAYLTDWTSGFRAFRSGALRALVGAPYRASMHGWQIEVLAQAIRHEMIIGEVPVTYRAGRSSFNWRVAREAVDVWRRL